MEELTLKTFKFPQTFIHKHVLTEGYNGSRHIYHLQDVDRNLALKRKTYRGAVEKNPAREKFYLEHEIIHTARDYKAYMPKNSTGHFYINDHGFNIRGELTEGRVTNLESFYEFSKATYSNRILHFGKGYEKYTRENIEMILKKAEKGSLKLENLTKIVMKKVLEYLPKK